jgi:hypothetical protein
MKKTVIGVSALLIAFSTLPAFAARPHRAQPVVAVVPSDPPAATPRPSASPAAANVGSNVTTDGSSCGDLDCRFHYNRLNEY